MRKFLASLMLLVLFAPFALRADEIVVGNGTETNNAAPFRTTSAYSWVEMLYPSSEIGQACTITSLSYQCTNHAQTGPTYDLTADEIKIYLAEVEKTALYAGQFTPESDLTLVYTGTNIELGDEEIETFVLDTPFEYSGTKNLCIVFSNGLGGTANSMSWQSTVVSNSILFNFHDTNPVGAMFPSEDCFLPNGAVYNKRPNVRLGISNGTTPEEPGSEYATTFSFDFENENLSDFTLIDADGDGVNWFIDGNGFNGYKASSQSYGILPGGYQYVALTPDNYLVTNEKYSIVSNSELTFHVACPWEEHYGVAISEDGVNFTTVFEESYTGDGGKDQTVDLSAYAGQNVYIAIRHFNCSGGYFVSVDNLVLTGDASGEEPVDPIEPEVVQYRIKASTTGKYLHAFNNTKHESGAFGGVGVADFAESNAQIFTIEEGTNNQVYFRNADGYYVKCWAWNVDAYSTTDKTALIMDDAGDGTFYLRNCDNQKYFKIEYVDAGGQYFAFGDCDGSNCPVETWTLVPVETEQPTAPATPANLAATATGETTIVLTWDAVEGATSYNVYSGTTTVATALTETSYTVENLTAGTEYCYNVTAVNEAGESEATADACATTNTAGPVNPGEGDFVIVGDVNTTGSTSVAPFRNSSKYSWVETYYPKEELGQAMTITSLAYKCATVNAGTGYTLTADEIEIYIGETDNDNHSSSAVWVPQNELTLVYSGANILLGEEEWESFTLDTPYEYSGTRNLAIAVSKSASSYNSAMKFASTTVSKANNYRGDDSNATFADYPAGNGATNGSRPIVKIGYSGSVVPEVPATPANLAATATSQSTIALTWDAVEGATEYNIYSGTETVATVTTNSYNATGLTAGTEYCYTVTAVNVAGESEASEEACATPTEAEQSEYALYADFENATLDGWRLIDADGDGVNWKLSTGNGGIVGVGGSNCIYSESWVGGSGINPDNYIVTTATFAITEGSVLEWDVLPNNYQFCEEHYGVVYSTDGEFFYTIWEETLTSSYEYEHRTLELDYIAGQTVYIGFRHYMCSDNDAVCIDNIALSLGDGSTTDPEVPVEGEVVIGNGTGSTYNAPFANYNYWSWVETIYPASEIGQACTINAISYNCTDPTFSCTNLSMKVYIGETTKATHSSITDWTPESDLTLVYSGTNVVIGDEEWERIVLDTPFEYSGENNLVVVVSNDLDNYYGNLKWYSTTSENSVLFAASDYESSAAQYPTGWGDLISDRPNIKLEYTYIPSAEIAAGDTWQDAIEVTEYPFAHTPDFANLNNDYTLPGEEQDGADVVYKLTFAEETTFSASVTGANGKVALYAEDFNGQENPGADNYYGAEEGEDPEQPEQPEDPEDPEGATTFLFDFNNANHDGLALIDADNDGLCWEIEPVGYQGGYVGYDNTCSILSYSWKSGYGQFTPDNYLVTEQAYAITSESVVSLNAKPASAYDYAEHYGIVVSEDGENWTVVFEETLSSANWINPTISLSQYAGKNLYIGIRHFDCTYLYYIMVDNFQLSTGSKRNRANAIDNMTVPAGTYYLVASATEAFSVNISKAGDAPINPDLIPVAQVTATENGANVDVAWTMNRNLAVTDAKSGKSIKLDETRDPSDYTFHSYKVYRANGDNEPIVLAENLTETTFQDATWAETESGVYKWGVAALYTANAKREEVTLINEGFEVGYYILPEGWTTYSDPATANQYGNFNSYSSLYSDITAYAGAYSAFTLGGYAEDGSLFYLVTPALDLSSTLNPTLNFHYVCPEFWGSVNTLSVKYGTSPTGPWTDVWTGETTSSWLDETIDLSECAGNTIYVAFCSVESGGWGVGVDNVVVKGTATDGPIPVASEIVWSNAIDKDMITTVAVNVTTDDGGSVEGTTVRLENVNEPTYVYETTLDATGQYSWTEFRKGTYEVTIALEGYYSCADGEIMEIMDATTIECTMEAKPELVDGLYVSPTGWAMWEYVASDFAGDTFEFDFETADLMGWTNIDADGDGNVWFSNESSLGAIPGHDSDYGIVSQSYDNTAGPLTPDNYIVSPEKYAIVQGSEFSFYVAAQDANYAAEHFGVAISTTGNTSAADFTTIYEATLTAKSNGQKGPRDGGRDTGSWYKHCVDLSAYAGQEVYIALRHFDCTDMFYILADDFKLGFRTADNIYDVVFNGETVADDITESFYQLDVTGLTEGEDYTTTVIVNNWTNQAMEYIWTYRACSNFAGVTNFAAVENDGNAVLTWTLPVYENQDPVYEFASNFDDGSLNGWNTIDADGDARNWQNTSEHANQGFGINNTYCASSSSYDNSVGALTPDNYLVTDVKYTITEGSTLTYSVCGQSNTYYAEHYGVAISTTNGTDAAAFTTIFEETLERGEVEQGSIQTQWFERTIDLSDYAGQAIYIAFRHFNCTDQWWINLDNVELSNPTRDEDGEWLYYDNGINESAFGFMDYNTGEPMTMYWAIMFPADVISQYAGTQITKVSMYVYEGHTGGVSIHTGGDYAPGTTVHVQEYEVSNTGQYEEIELTTPVTISGTENVWIQFSNTSGYFVAAHSADCGEANGRWMSNDGITWYDANWYGVDFGYGTWQIRAYVEGEANPNPSEPEQAEAEVLGVMLYRDGELLTETPLNAETYTDNGLATGEHEYEVRVVYGGDDASTYYAMSCPQEATVTMPLDCVAPEDLYGEYTYNNANSFGATLRWPYNGSSASDWLYYDDGMMVDGIGGPQTFYWGIMFPAESLAQYTGSFLTKVAMFDRVATTTTLQIYYGGTTAPETLVHTQECSFSGINDFTEIDLTAALPIDPSMNIWVVMLTNDGANAYPASCCANTGDPNGRWISMDGSVWEDVVTYSLSYTWMIRAYASSTAKGEVSELRPIAVENNNVANNNATLVAQNGGKGSTLDHYNVYRSTTNGNYQVIAETEVGYYFDEINESGTYYYQVTAVYAENGLECESDPANAYENESQNYVVVEVTAIDENGVKGMMIYPNPTKDNLTITAENMTRITITNTLGQVIFDQEVSSDNEMINMSQYEAGVYMVRITTENGVAVERITVL